MKRPEEKGTCGVRAPGETTRFETASSAPGLHDTGASTAFITKAVPTEPDNLSASSPAAKGVNTADPLAAAHVELTRAFGLLLTMPEVELALRHSGQWYDARSMLFRHQELARARGAQ